LTNYTRKIQNIQLNRNAKSSNKRQIKETNGV
jgi:hypothetical protein